MAGRTLQFFSGAVNGAGALVRAMPNTPAAIGRGITVGGAAWHRRRAARARAASARPRPARSNGSNDEALMDAVTAVSGSGPAYVFLLAEALAQAGVAAGLPPPLAAKTGARNRRRLGRIVASLAARLPPCLRENVTSPGGTTAAALASADGEERPGAADARAPSPPPPRARANSPAEPWLPWKRHAAGLH